MSSVRHRTSPLQRCILIVLAALDAQQPGTCVPTRLIEKLLTGGGHGPVYGPNLRASCRRMEAAGWLRTLRAPNLQLAVELTPEGQTLATSLLADEQARVQAEQRAAEVHVLPLVPAIPEGSPGPTGDDIVISLNGVPHTACRGDFVIRLDGTTCLQLWSTGGRVTRLEGDPLQVAGWLQACHAAGIAVGVQVNESPVPAEVHRSPQHTYPDQDATDTLHGEART
ncbi:hypothetical protein ACFX4S_15045 [Kosakonia sp. YIM B13605]|uniref:hypothetical protein n=1 Tax=Kosakonia TaxID=1330547 RepID=UPI0028A9AC45|nr:hypothetical protein [Kosakonia sacchari]